MSDAGLIFEPLTASFGAEVLGLNLGAPVSAPQQDALRAAYRRHQLLVIRGQTITPAQQARFGEIFGDIRIREHNKVKPVDDTGQYVSNVRADGVFGLGELRFHMDQLFYEDPLHALILYAVEVPDTGGDTLFCDCSAVLAGMPAALQTKIGDLSCRTMRSYDAATAERFNVDVSVATRVSAVHPLVWTEPDTGRRSLWLSGTLATEMVGLDDAETAEVIAAVRHHIDEASAVYRHVWRPHDLVLWNNRTLQHARTPFDPSKPRTLRRTPIIGPEVSTAP